MRRGPRLVDGRDFEPRAHVLGEEPKAPAVVLELDPSDGRWLVFPLWREDGNDRYWMENLERRRFAFDEGDELV